jgi:hypothetical protein
LAQAVNAEQEEKRTKERQRLQPPKWHFLETQEGLPLTRDNERHAKLKGQKRAHLLKDKQIMTAKHEGSKAQQQSMTAKHNSKA